MANKKITELDAVTTLASTDVVPVVDVSADTTNKITAANLFRTLPDGTAAAPALAFSSDAANGVYLAGTDTVGISTGGTQRVTVDGSGNVTISGDLTVSGATTTVESTTVTIDDKNIELGSVATPTDTTADGGGITLKASSDKTIKWINSTGYWTFNTGIDVGGNIELADNSKIQLGTGDDLQIYHDGSNSYIDDSGTGALYVRGSYLAFAGINGEQLINAEQNAAVELYYNNSRKLLTKSDGIDVTGEVQSDSLDVDGAAMISGKVGIGTDSVTTQGKLYVVADSGNSNDVKIALSPTNSSGGTNPLAQVAATANGTYGSDMYFTTRTTGGTTAERLRIDQQGNVGIGTSAPTVLLDLESTSPTIRLTDSDASGTPECQISGAGGDLILEADRDNEKSDSLIKFLVDGSEHLRVNSSGNVGIGATSYTEKLHVSGAYNQTGLKVTGGGAGYSSPLIVGAANGNEYLRVDDDGRLSVGNTSASSMNSAMNNFVLGSGSGSEGMVIYSGSSSSGFVGFNDAASSSTQGVIEYNHSGNHMGFRTADAERARIDSSGRFLLGTTTEGASSADNLTVADSGACGITIRSGTTSTGNIFFSDGTSGSAETSGYVLYNHNTNAMIFGTNDVSRLEINSNGAWGIEGASNYGTSGQVLTSNGNDAPTWQDAGSASVGGASAISMNDNVKINFGASNDLQIFHDGTDTYVRNNQGDLILQTISPGDDVILRAHDDVIIQSGGSDNAIICNNDGDVELYHNTSKKFETSSTGVTVIGTTQTERLVIVDDGSASPLLTLRADDQGPWAFVIGNDTYSTTQSSGLAYYQDNSGNCYQRLNGSSFLNFYLQQSNGSTNNTAIHIDTNRAVNLKYQNNTKLSTKSDGVDIIGELQCDSLDNDGSSNFAGDCSFFGGAAAVQIEANSDIRLKNGTWTGEHAAKLQLHGNYLYIQGGSNGFIFRSSGGTDRVYLDSSGHLLPASNNTYDLGTSSYRWRNVYTNDLNLSNEGSGNDVDGTWGNYTIQEGEDDLFLINRRNGKKYKFNLTEVS